MTTSDTTRVPGTPRGAKFLMRTARAWFVVAAVGQMAFVWMIVAHYGQKTLGGNLVGWNDKPLIKGYVAGDTAGNAMFALHVLLAAVVTLGGLLQLVPAIRRHAPSLHRWNGRLFFFVAYVMAFGGLWLTWVRQTWLSVISAIAVSVDAVLIVLCSTIAWRMARNRNFVAHRRWALRAFLVMNGVWFLRVGIMAWLLTTGGVGMNKTLSGPADIALQFGAYLIPLAALEAYFHAQGSRNFAAKAVVGGVLLLATLVTGVGIFGAVAFMWGPYMK